MMSRGVAGLRSLARHLATSAQPAPKAGSSAAGRVALYGLGATGLAAGAYLATSEHPASSARLLVQFPVRLARDVTTALIVIAGRSLVRRKLSSAVYAPASATRSR